MMNAFLDFVGVVSQQLPKKGEHRFFFRLHDCICRERRRRVDIRHLQHLLCPSPGRPVEKCGASDGPQRPNTRYQLIVPSDKIFV